MMKKIALAMVGAMVLVSVGFAADAENTDTSKTDVSKNPLTGTKTTKTVEKKKVKGAHGEADVKVTHETKEHKDGTVEHKEDVKGSASDKH